jgi:hypothetical protein
MNEDGEVERAIELLLWGKKGYPESKNASTNAFSIEKVVDFLRKKQESERDDDI